MLTLLIKPEMSQILLSTLRRQKTSSKNQCIFVMDQCNTHKSEALVRWVAEQCQIDKELDKKEKEEIFKDMNPRATFLTNTEHRIRFFYTPKHCS